MAIFERIADCIVNMDEDSIGKLMKEAVETEGLDMKRLFTEGLDAGLIQAIEQYDRHIYDIPELIVCADTMNKGIAVLRQLGIHEDKDKGRILLAVVAGDTHEIGKNIVKIMLEAAGYDVLDFGVNRTVDDIIEAARENHCQIIALSSMMTTTRGGMKQLIDRISSMRLEEKPLVIVGGGSVTQNYALEIGSDGYASNVPNAVKLVRQLLGGDSQ